MFSSTIRNSIESMLIQNTSVSIDWSICVIISYENICLFLDSDVDEDLLENEIRSLSLDQLNNQSNESFEEERHDSSSDKNSMLIDPQLFARTDMIVFLLRFYIRWRDREWLLFINGSVGTRCHCRFWLIEWFTFNHQWNNAQMPFARQYDQ
jgi:hypothetical protein